MDCRDPYGPVALGSYPKALQGRQRERLALEVNAATVNCILSMEYDCVLSWRPVGSAAICAKINPVDRYKSFEDQHDAVREALRAATRLVPLVERIRNGI